jgi:hypothetical protein
LDLGPTFGLLFRLYGIGAMVLRIVPVSRLIGWFPLALVGAGYLFGGLPLLLIAGFAGFECILPILFDQVVKLHTFDVTAQDAITYTKEAAANSARKEKATLNLPEVFSLTRRQPENRMRQKPHDFPLSVIIPQFNQQTTQPPLVEQVF